MRSSLLLTWSIKSRVPTGRPCALVTVTCRSIKLIPAYVALGPLEGPWPCSLSTTYPRFASWIVVFGLGEVVKERPATCSPVNDAFTNELDAFVCVIVLDTLA